MFTKRTVLIVLVFFVLIIGIVIFFAELGHNTSLVTTNQLSLVSISPTSGSPLRPNQKQSITVTFNNPVSETDISIRLQKINVYEQQNAQPVPFVPNYTNNRLTIFLSENILPGYNYILKLTNSKTGGVLFQSSYNVLNPTPTPLPNNNQALKQYLPLQTNSYSLIYSPEKNLYIFSFFYDPSSPDSFETQRQNAINAVNSFIQSKGIDPNSLQIQWQ